MWLEEGLGLGVVAGEMEAEPMVATVPWFIFGRLSTVQGRAGKGQKGASRMVSTQTMVCKSVYFKEAFCAWTKHARHQTTQRPPTTNTRKMNE